MNHEENLTYDWFRKLSNVQESFSLANAATAIVNRAITVLNSKNWTYSLVKGSKSKPDPRKVLPGMPSSSDCTGFVLWCWGANPSKRMSDVAVKVSRPEVGSAFWYDPKPEQGMSYGHGGIIVAVNGNNFDTVDCGKSVNGIRYIKNARSFWAGSAKGNQNLEFWKPTMVPAFITNPEQLDTSTQQTEPSYTSLASLSRNNTNNKTTLSENRNKKILSEEEPFSPVNPAQAIRNRAMIAFNSKNWTYSLEIGSSKPDPKKILPGMPTSSDCTGFVTWCWGADPSKRMSDVATRVTNPEVGSAFWYPPPPGNTYGHGGIIIAVNGDNFETLDCGMSVNGIRYTQDGRGRWSRAAGGSQNLEFWKPSTIPPDPGNPELFAYGSSGGVGTDTSSTSGDANWMEPFVNSLRALGLKEDNREFSSTKWKEYRREIISEERIRDFVRGRNAVAAQDVEALDVEFTDVGDARGNIKLDPSWVSNNIISVTLSPGNTLQFNKKYAKDLAVAYQRACDLTGYCPANNGGWVPRRSLSSVAKNQPVEQRDIGGHAWGTSFDLLIDKSNPKAVEFANELKKGNPKTGTTFIWGGDWEESGEETHFEVNFSGKPPVTTPFGGGIGVRLPADSNSSFDQQNQGDWQTSFVNSLKALGLKENKKRMIKESSSRCLSDDQIAKLLYDVGFRDEDLVTAVRIVIGESGGCPNATNVNRGAKGKYKDSVDRGIFQFNNVAFPNFSDEEAFDPIKSAQYAFRVYKKVGFRPWKGKTQFHTLKHKDLTPDTNKIERAKNAVAKLTGYVSTGNFEYLPQDYQSGTSSSQEQVQSGGDWQSAFVSSLRDLGLKESRIRIGKKFIVVNKSKNKDIEQNKKILFSMLKYYDDKLQFDLPVKIIFKDDRDNSQKPLGKTGYYHPEETSITIFTTNRLLKDILRSLGHELIHHKQHCIHPFESHKTPEGYAQADKRLRRKEKEAYLYGNLLFRDFEDNYKTKHKGVF